MHWLIDDFGQIGGHILIAMGVKPWAQPVIAHVHGDDFAVGGQAFGDDAPIAGRAEEPMRNQQGGQVGGSAVSDEIEHRVSRVCPVIAIENWSGYR